MRRKAVSVNNINLRRCRMNNNNDLITLQQELKINNRKRILYHYVEYGKIFYDSSTTTCTTSGRIVTSTKTATTRIKAVLFDNPLNYYHTNQQILLCRYLTTTASSKCLNNNINNNDGYYSNLKITNNNDDENQLQKTYDSLMESSRNLLLIASSSSNHKTVITSSANSQQLQNISIELEDTIFQWHSFLINDNKNNIIHINYDGIELIGELYRSYIKNVKLVIMLSINSKSKKSTTTIKSDSDDNNNNLPSNNRIIQVFQRMLQLYANIIPNSGFDALEMLHDWNDLYHGNIQLAATKENYNQILQSYLNIELLNNNSNNNNPLANTNTNELLSDENQNHQHNYNDYYRTIYEGSLVAIEIREQLEQWGYTMEPDVRTYQLVIQCISNTIQHMTTRQSKLCQYIIHNHDHDDDDNHSNHSASNIISSKLSSLHQNLNITMDHLIQSIIKKHYKNVGTITKLSESMSENESLLPTNVMNSLNDDEFTTLMMCISDIIRCNKNYIVYNNMNNINVDDNYDNDIPTIIQNDIKWQHLWIQMILQLTTMSSLQNKRLFTIQNVLNTSSPQYQQHEIRNKYNNNNEVLLNTSTDDSVINLSSSLSSLNHLADFIDKTTDHYLIWYRNITSRNALLQQQNTVINEVNTYLSCLKEFSSNLEDNITSSIKLPSLFHYNQIIIILKNLREEEVQFDLNENSNNIIEQQQVNYLHEMNEVYNSIFHNKDTYIDPTKLTLYTNLLMKSYLDCNQPSHVIRIWDNMKNKSSNHNHFNIRRDMTSFGYILKALAKESCTTMTHQQWKDTSHSRALKAHSIWKNMLSISHTLSKKQQEQQNQNQIMNTPLSSQNNNDNDFEDQDDSSSNKNNTFIPTSNHYESVMMAWCRSYHPNAAVYCQEVYDQLISDAKVFPINPPDIKHDRALISTLGYSSIPGCYERILQIYDKYQNDVKTNTTTSQAQQQHQSSGFIDRSDIIMNESILFALSQLTKDVTGATRTETMFEDLLKGELQIRQQHRKDIKMSNDAESNNQFFQPILTTNCYNSVMIAWVKAGDKDSSQHCEQFFQKLQDAYIESNYHPDLRPNSYTYVALIDSYIKSFNNMSESNNDNNSYDIGKKASELLDEMEQGAINNLCDYPDVNVYTAVMKAYWKQGDDNALENVEYIYNRMKYSYEKLHNMKAKPDAHAMTVLLHAWAKSNHRNKAFVTWDILQSMIESYEKGDINMKPTPYSFAAVLNACAFMELNDATKQGETIRIALSCMNSLDDNSVYGKPNEFIYKNLFQTICRNVSDMKERSRIASIIFQRCCQDGYVTKTIIGILRKNIPDLYKKLPLLDKHHHNNNNSNRHYNNRIDTLYPSSKQQKQNHDENQHISSRIHEIPKEWTRNVFRK